MPNIDSDVDRAISSHVAQLPQSVAVSAARLGISRPSLYGRLSGRTRWTASELPAVAELCGVTVSELIGERSR